MGTPVPSTLRQRVDGSGSPHPLVARLRGSAPPWTRQPERILGEPRFATPRRHTSALLLVESPAAFRERNLFVSANALSIA